MDTNQDNILKYPDFCKLCSEHVYQNIGSDGASMSGVSRGNTDPNDPYMTMLKQLKEKGHAIPKGVKGLASVEKRIDNRHKSIPKDSYEGVKNVPGLMDTDHVSQELRRFALKRGHTPKGAGVCSPGHNRIDGIRDETVYNSINSSMSAWSTVSNSTRARDSAFRRSLQSATHGATSEQITLKKDPRQKANGGQVAGCINGDYERDFMMESLLNDRRFQERKAVKKSFDLNRGTKTTELRKRTASRKLKILKDKEALAYAPEKTHDGGVVPQFYPMVKINDMLNERQASNGIGAIDAKKLLATLDAK